MSAAQIFDEARHSKLKAQFQKHFIGLSANAMVFSAPGRSELVGNHTDHNAGEIIAAAVDLDIAALAQPCDKMRVRLWSQDYRTPIVVELNRLHPLMEERHRSEGLIRGIAAGIKRRGLPIGGFDAAIDSRLPIGGGLSSSAAFEMLIVSIFDRFYVRQQQETGLDIATRAEIGRCAENDYFGKPSGMMDQLASAHGSILHIDFKDPQQPQIEPLEDRFAEWGLQLAIVDTASSHADLNDEYGAVANEMHAIANHLMSVPPGSNSNLRSVSEEMVIGSALTLARRYGDRAVLRAMHFFDENRRVGQMVAAIRQANPQAYLRAMQASGHSSWMLLQNCALSGRPEYQPVVLALALTQHFLDRHPSRTTDGMVGACRVHGGGFAGAIQILLDATLMDEYEAYMRSCMAMEAPIVPNLVSRLNVSVRGAGVLDSLQR